MQMLLGMYAGQQIDRDCKNMGATKVAEILCGLMKRPVTLADVQN